MTKRLYYDDAYLKAFSATVTGWGNDDSGSWLTLDQSAFYPTSGGQPHDTGTLSFDGGTVQVTDVVVDSAGELRHYTDRTVPAGTMVQGSIDWPRRFDHMQQHLGEHLLAGTIARIAKGYTIGLHIGDEDATIDVMLPGGAVSLPAPTWREIEDAVNGIILEDLPVRCWFPEPEELKRLPLRKAPAVTEHVRIVAAGDAEMVACGGTHPHTTGQAGLVKVLHTQAARGKMRVHFVCGMRSLRVFQRTLMSAQEAGRLLSAPLEDLPLAIQALKERLSASQNDLARLRRETALTALLAQLGDTDNSPAGWRVLARVMPHADMDGLSALAGEIVVHPGVIALLAGNADERSVFVFACSPDVPHDMSVLLKATGIRGGGRHDFARGSGEAGTDAECLLALAQQAIPAK